MPQSVYNWAKMFNININKATPAYADIDIIINKSDLDEAIGKKTGKQYKKQKPKSIPIPERKPNEEYSGAFQR